MILIRRLRCVLVKFSLIWLYIFVFIVCFYSLHYIWCATKSICANRFLCPRREIVISPNISKILDNEYSLCSMRSTSRGPHQHVIGVSAYLSTQDNIKLLPKIKTYLLEYIEEAKIKYPDWIVRVYYYALNISKEEIFYIEDTYKNVDFCDSTNIPVFGNILNWFPGKMQRFLPIADPLVDIYMSRDIDSPILDRELTVVDAWLNSEKTIHIMRDHIEHTPPILGGLWGIKLDKERSWIKNISQYLLTPDIVRCYTGEGDQTFLEDYIWPRASIYNKFTLEYDSFFCEKYPNSLPYPTRKESGTRFIGCRRPSCTTDEHPPCPEKCRPVNHSDWIWC